MIETTGINKLLLNIVKIIWSAVLRRHKPL